MRLSDSHKTLLAAIQISSSSLFLNIISIPITAIIIRKLGKEGYGEWMTGISLASLMFSLFNFGYRTLFIRRIAEESVDLISETANQLMMRLLISMFPLAISGILSVFLGYPIKIVICTMISATSSSIMAVGSVFADIFQGKQNMKQLSIINFCSGFSLTAISLIVALKGGDAVYMAISYISGPVISATCMYAYITRNYFVVKISFNKFLLFERIKESYLIGLAGVISTIRDRVEHIFIPKMIGIPAYGIFAASVSLPDRLIIVPSSIGDAFFSRIARSQNGAMDSVKQLIITSVMVCIPVSLIIAFLAEVFASILFPANLVSCTQVIKIAAFSLPIAALALSMNIALQATRAHNEAAKASIWASIASIGISLWLIFHYGIVGATISQLTRPLLSSLACQPNFERRFPNVLRQSLTPSVAICAGLMGSFLWFVRYYFGGSINELVHHAPWIRIRSKDVVSVLSASSTLFYIIEIIAWIAASLIIYIGIGLLLNVIPRNIFMKLREIVIK